MESSNKNRITEEEIIRAIRQVGENTNIIEAFKSVSEEELKEILERDKNKKLKARKMK